MFCSEIRRKLKIYREMCHKWERMSDEWKLTNAHWIALACNHEADDRYTSLTNERAIALLENRLAELRKLPPAAFVGDVVCLDEETEA